MRFGGLGISNPTLTSDEQYTFSRELLHGLTDLIYHQNPALSEDVVHHQHEIFRHLSSVKERSLPNQLQSTLSSCPPPLRWAVECCTEKGSSSWLTALPLEQYGFIRVSSLVPLFKVWLHAITTTISLCVWQGF